MSFIEGQSLTKTDDLGIILNATGMHGNNAPKHTYSTPSYFTSLLPTFVYYVHLFSYLLCLPQRLITLQSAKQMINTRLLYLQLEFGLSLFY